MSDDRGFSEDALSVLASVLDEIIPPSDDGKIPGAGQAGVATHLDRALRTMPDLHAMIAQGLSDLEEVARARHGQPFRALTRDRKRDLLGEQGFIMPLTLHTYVGYYQNEQVVAALGLDPRPPHPQGYEMGADDFTLLDPVRRRPKLYRDA